MRTWLNSGLSDRCDDVTLYKWCAVFVDEVCLRQIRKCKPAKLTLLLQEATPLQSLGTSQLLGLKVALLLTEDTRYVCWNCNLKCVIVRFFRNLVTGRHELCLTWVNLSFKKLNMLFTSHEFIIPTTKYICWWWLMLWVWFKFY